MASLAFHLPAPSALRGRTAATLLWFGGLVLLPYAVPPLPWRGLLPDARWAEVAQSVAPPAPAPVEVAVNEPEAVATPAPVVRPGEAIEDPSGHALDDVMAALEKVESGVGQVRISHYGDSPITGDLITRTIRAGLQARFGDAGHGFVLLGKPWPWYQQQGVGHETSPGWKAQALFLGRKDGLFGFGGASFETAREGAWARFRVLAPHAVSAFEVAYLARPGGGDLDLEVDAEPVVRISTAAPAALSEVHRLPVEPGRHTLTIRTVGEAPVRVFGVALRSDAPGVVYDSLGLNGAFIGLFAQQMDREHWVVQLRQQRPDLVVLNFGANESQYEDWPMARYEKDTREVVARLREALPGVAILFLGPMDRGARGADGSIVTRRTIPRLVEAQRRLAAELRCAFFDTYAAMGGEGTAARWFVARPRLMSGDFTHPTVQGSEIVGGLVRDALLRSYQEWRARPRAH